MSGTESSGTKSLRKEVFYPHPPSTVWVALTDPRALAEWLMPNDFRPVEGHEFQFRVDPMLGFTGVNQCRVVEVDPPRRLVYTWASRMKGKPDPPPMRVTWTLHPERGGTRLVLEQVGLESLSLWWRFSARAGWGRMLKRLLPRVLENVGDDGSFTPGARTKRDFGTKTVPEHFAR